MQDASSFFGGSGGLYARPPKRIKPANRGAANAYVMGSNTIPSRVAAGTYLELPYVYGSTGAVTLRQASTGNSLGSSTGLANGWLSYSFCYDWVAGIFYGIAASSTQIQLYQINDTTGAITAVGGLQTPANIANWTGTAATGAGHAYIVAGNLKFITNETGTGTMRVHTVSLSTGAIVSQDQALTLSDGTTVTRLEGISYVTADESAVISQASDPTYGYSQIAFAKGGTVLFRTRNATYPADGVAGAPQARWVYNGESVCLVGVASVAQPGWRFYDRTDFDRYVKELIKAIAGV